MKKAVTFALFSVFTLAAAAAHADSGSTITGSRGNGPDAERHARRAALIAERKANPSSDGESTRRSKGGESKMSKFWKNEAERSGVSQWKLPSMNPGGFFKEQDRKYKERKAAK